MLNAFHPGVRRRRREEPAPSRVTLRAIGSRQRAAAEAIVSSDPIRNVHAGAFLWTLDTLFGPRDLLAGVYRDGRLAALLQRGRGLSWAARPEDREAGWLLEVLADALARGGAVKEVVIGPRPSIERLLTLAGHRGVGVVEHRPQVMMAADRRGPGIAAPASGLLLRAARFDDLPWLLETHAAMCREDLGSDQVARQPEAYTRYFRELIGQGRAFVGESAGERVFKAEAPLDGPATRLVEGVFTLPSHRGRGHAAEAMGLILQQAWREGRRTCLYVQQRNQGAQRLYRRLGFVPVCSWATSVVGHGWPAWRSPDC